MASSRSFLGLRPLSPCRDPTLGSRIRNPFNPSDVWTRRFACTDKNLLHNSKSEAPNDPPTRRPTPESFLAFVLKDSRSWGQDSLHKFHLHKQQAEKQKSGHRKSLTWPRATLLSCTMFPHRRKKNAITVREALVDTPRIRITRVPPFFGQNLVLGPRPPQQRPRCIRQKCCWHIFCPGSRGISGPEMRGQVTL